jgi:ATP-dependent DNA helicase RecG
VLPGVGPQIAKRLARIRLRTIGDVLLHRPRRYEAAAAEVRIADLSGEEEVAIAGEVLRTSVRPLRGRRTLVQSRITDGSGEIVATWFNQPWLAEQLRPGHAGPGTVGFFKFRDEGA